MAEIREGIEPHPMEQGSQQLHQLPLQSVFEHSTWITIHKRNLLRPYYQKAREARS